MHISQQIPWRRIPYCIYLLGMGQDLDVPDNLDAEVFMDYIDKRLEDACPSGIDRCECVHAPGL